MADDAAFSLVLAFDSDNPEFVRGVEAGRLWEQLKGDEPVHQTIHGTNSEMAIRMCEALDLSFSAEPLGDDGHWIDFHSPAESGEES